jgi:hypothetical protein
MSLPKFDPDISKMRTAWGNVLRVVTLIAPADKLSAFALRRFEVRHEICYVLAFLTLLPRQGCTHTFQKSR